MQRLKNFKDVVIVPSVNHYYAELLDILNKNNGFTTLEERRRFATYAFMESSDYDTAIFNYFNRETNLTAFKESYNEAKVLR